MGKTPSRCRGFHVEMCIRDSATALHFSILNTAEFDCVVLSHSDKIEDMEPDWVANEKHLCAVVGSSVAVSYTHLDVYKRQGRRTARW